MLVLRIDDLLGIWLVKKKRGLIYFPAATGRSWPKPTIDTALTSATSAPSGVKTALAGSKRGTLARHASAARPSRVTPNLRSFAD